MMPCKGTQMIVLPLKTTCERGGFYKTRYTQVPEVLHLAIFSEILFMPSECSFSSTASSNLRAPTRPPPCRSSCPGRSPRCSRGATEHCSCYRLGGQTGGFAVVPFAIGTTILGEGMDCPFGAPAPSKCLGYLSLFELIFAWLGLGSQVRITGAWFGRQQMKERRREKPPSPAWCVVLDQVWSKHIKTQLVFSTLVNHPWLEQQKRTHLSSVVFRTLSSPGA